MSIQNTARIITYAHDDGFRHGFRSGIEAAAKLLDQEAHHSAYAAELAASVRSLACSESEPISDGTIHPHCMGTDFPKK